MSLMFAMFALLTLAGAVGAVTRRNLIHGALCLTVAFAGLAGIYLHLGAVFVGLVQVLVYIGAVAILLVFAILLTRAGNSTRESSWSASAPAGVAVAGVVFGALLAAVLTGLPAPGSLPPEPRHQVRQIGVLLMTQYVLPLEVIGLLLTAALIGAVVIALKEPSDRSP